MSAGSGGQWGANDATAGLYAACLKLREAVAQQLGFNSPEIAFADGKSSPMKAKGVGETGLCGVGAAIANAIYNATDVRVRDYPITLDKHLEKLPQVA